MFMGFSCEDNFEEKEESKVLLIDESSSTSAQQRSIKMMEVHQHHHQDGVEKNVDFWPVEHPLEPADDDRPVKCPMPESSVINDGGMHEQRFSESLRKRVETSGAMADRERTAAMNHTEPPARAVRKRHHTLTHEGGDLVMTPLMRMPSLPTLPNQNITIFQMLQQLDKFDP